MDTAGDVDGHILVVPKKHTESILDCDDETLSRLMCTVRRVSLHLVEDCGYRGVNLLNASGESAGQSVPHFHIHLIPRYRDDGQTIGWKPGSPSDEELKALAGEIRL